MEQNVLIDALQSYEGMSALLKAYRYEEILEQAARLAGVSPEELEGYPMGGYSKGCL